MAATEPLAPAPGTFWSRHGAIATFIASTVVSLLAITTGMWVALHGTTASIQADAERQQEQVEEARALEARELRRASYAGFADAANRYAQTQLERAACVPGTDLPVEGEVCAVSLQQLQRARFDFQGAVNSMYQYGTEEAIDSVVAVAESLPASMVGPAGDPVDGQVDQDAFLAAYDAFLDALHCDTNPEPAESCTS